MNLKILGMRLCLMNVALSCRAHDTWSLPEPPDYVTFSKKMLLGGFYNQKGVRPKEVGL